jgi:hypothetical protein
MAQSVADYLRQRGVNNQPGEGPDTGDRLAAILKRRGSERYEKVARSIFQQESSGGAVDTSRPNGSGARGPMQVIEPTFKQMQQEGRIPADYQWDNPDHSMEAGVAYIESLGEKTGGDPRKIAQGYYGGPGAIGRESRRDPRNPGAPTVGQYSNQVVSRMGVTGKGGRMSPWQYLEQQRNAVPDIEEAVDPGTQTADPPGQKSAPAAGKPMPWMDVVRDDIYQKADADTREAIRNAYWEEQVSPQIPAEQQAAARQAFDADTTGQGRNLSDLGASFGSGSGALASSLGYLWGAATGNEDNVLTRLGQDTQEHWQNDSKSLRDQQDQLDVQREVDAADGELGKAWAAVKGTVSRPRRLANFMAEQIPMFVPGAGVGRGAGAAAAVLGATGRVAGGMATGAAVGTGAALQGADAAQQTLTEITQLASTQPEEVWAQNDGYRQLRERGMSHDQAAKTIATNLAKQTFAMGAGASALLALLPGGAIIERTLAGAGRKVSGGMAVGAARGFAGEAVNEGLDEGASRAAGNLSVQQVDPSRELSYGVGEAAGLGAVMGGVMGAPAGAAEGLQAKAERTRQAADAARSGQPIPPPAAPPAPSGAAPAGPVEAPASKPRRKKVELEGDPFPASDVLGTPTPIAAPANEENSGTELNSPPVAAASPPVSPTTAPAAVAPPVEEPAPPSAPTAPDAEDAADLAGETDFDQAAADAEGSPDELASVTPDPAVIETIPGDNGTEVRIAKNPKGFAVLLHDTDSGETVPHARIYPTLEGAQEHARKLAGTGPRAGKIGDKLAAGEVVTTASGRPTTPFPKGDVSTNRKAANTVKRIDAWLMENAVEEARARGDEFNLRQFEANKDRPQQADKDSAEEYLFGGNQPSVPPPLLKPLDRAAHEAATSPTNDLPEPTEAQKEAGNYKVGRVRVQGLDISIENPQGSERKGTGRDGKPWSVTMPGHYGYIKGTVGKDKDHLDVTLGDAPDDTSRPVFVFNQANESGGFDEHKIFLGYPDADSARQAYRDSFSGKLGQKMENSLLGIAKYTPEQFKAWLADGDHKKPANPPKTDKGRLVPTRGPNGSVVWTAEPVEETTVGKPRPRRETPEERAARLKEEADMDAAMIAAESAAPEEAPAAASEASLSQLMIEASAFDDDGAVEAFSNGDRAALESIIAKGKGKGTAPEHARSEGKPLDTSTVYEPTADPAHTTYDAELGRVDDLTIPLDDFKEATDEWAELFADPEEYVSYESREKAGKIKMLNREQADAKIAAWKKHAKDQAKKVSNSSRTILSLFDYTGEWSKPWFEAGYNVVQLDIQHGTDIFDLSVEWLNDNDIGDVYGILAACPCTDFASSGARHFAGKDADGRTEASKELVFQTLRSIEYLRPAFWVLENPVGRIESLTGLPKARAAFHPNHFGAPYTKKTMLWGKFNAEMPTAAVPATEGSKMHRLFGGKSQATKNARSETPEGFAYAFFMANNWADKSFVTKMIEQYPEASGAIKAAVAAGVEEDLIRDTLYATYEYGEPEASRAELARLVQETRGKRPKLVEVGDRVQENNGFGVVTAVDGDRFTVRNEDTRREFTYDGREIDPENGVTSGFPAVGWISNQGTVAPAEAEPAPSKKTIITGPEAAGRAAAADGAPREVPTYATGKAAKRWLKGYDDVVRDRKTENAGPVAEEAVEQPPERQAVDSKWGKDNTVFTKKKADAARARLLAKRGHVNEGLDPEMVQDGLTLAGYHIESGARSFADFVRRMFADLGAEYLPYFKSWYMAAMADPQVEAIVGDDPIDDFGQVRKMSVEAVSALLTEAATPQPEPAEPAARPAREIVTHTTRKGKVLRGTIVRGITKEAAKEIDKYTWAMNGGWFIREEHFAALDRVEATGQRPVPVTKPEPTDGISGVERSFVNAVKARLAPGRVQPQLATLREARELHRQHTGADPDGPAVKRVDELVELAVIEKAREIIAMGHPPKVVFEELQQLYASQPKLTTRTSTSVEQQAYSTPAPLAYLASVLAGVRRFASGKHYGTRVYEPTAGNGMLLIAADPNLATVNELNDGRARNLREQGFRVFQEDATDYSPASDHEVILANPPFGVLRDANGDSTQFTVETPTMGSFTTNEIDHKIAFKALAAMASDGRAVLIVGGLNEQLRGEEARSDGYNSAAKRKFYYHLYGSYNVVDHFTVSGDLYERQGAGWPVDVIVIEGRGKSSRKLPAVDVPRVYDSWEALAPLLERADGSKPTQDQAGSVGTGSQPGSPDAGGSGVAVGPSDNVGRPGRLDRPADTGNDRPGNGPGSAGTPVAGGTDGGGTVAGRPSSPRQPRRDADNVESGRQDATAGTRSDAARPRRPDAEPDTGDGQPRSPVDFGGGSAESGRGTAELAQPDRVSAVASDGQVPYRPRSKTADLQTLVPVNMQTAIEDSLDALEAEVGPIDAYVAAKLGYDVSKLSDYFGAEQVDALGLAISQVERGSGFIIGDQTGIGKGRVVAAMIRYAIKHGLTPVFVTEKPNLYGDMMRDLEDVGVKNIKPLMTNGDEKVPYGPDGEFELKPLPAAKLQKLADEATLGEHDVLFTTYSQMQGVGGAFSRPRHQLLRAIASNALLIFDESHNAGGQTAGRTSRRQGIEAGEKSGRAGFARDLIGQARGVFYSSATYAKRPEVMDLYSKTDMVLAVESPSRLPAAIEAGGVPLQQAVASMLAKSGQYIRRERTFDGVEYNSPVVPVDRQSAEALASVMSAVAAFDDAKGPALRNIKKELKAEAAIIGQDGATGAVGATSTNFTSLMHNVIDQMLLTLKVDAAAEKAIEALKRGEKPVVTVAFTMGAFIEDYVDSAGLHSGDAIDVDFRSIMLRYLDRSRDVTIKDAAGNQSRRPLTDEELGPMGRAAFARAQRLIMNSEGIEKIPLSPIDRLHYLLRKAGYKTGEITGRSHTIEYGDSGESTFRLRPERERKTAGKIATIRAFNNGDMDVVILNQSGATGLSLHASSKFKDQRRRRMIIAQAERNIDTHMQMLGRVHRTGQVIPPAYDQLVADIPAEKRPAAILSKKMASLNANTTASRTSALTAKDTPDFMNDYGDQVVAQLMKDMPEVHESLLEPLNDDEEGFEVEGAARKVTGRIPLLPLEQQEQLYEAIEEAYAALIEQENALGTNKLEAKTLNLDARTSESHVIFEGDSSSPSPFAGPAHMERINVAVLAKAYTADQVRTIAATRNGLDTGATWAQIQQAGERRRDALVADVGQRYAGYREELLAGMTERGADERAIEARGTALDSVKDRVIGLLDGFQIGRTYEIGMGGDFSTYGVLTDLTQKKGAKNPTAPGSWVAHFLVADGSKKLDLPISRLMSDDGLRATRTDYESDGNYGSVMDLFDSAQSVNREDRWVATGNLLAAFGQLSDTHGQVVNFTDDAGRVRQGVLMPKKYKFDAAAMEAEKPVYLTADAAISFIRNAGQDWRHARTAAIESANGPPVRIVPFGYNGMEISVPKAKSKGGEVYLDQGLRDIVGDFTTRGNKMRVTIDLGADSDLARRALGYIGRKWGSLKAVGAKEFASSSGGTKDAKQLVYSRSGSPVFYSATLKTVEGAKQEKMTAEQWEGWLKNQPGIKQEELDWLGLNEWLRSQGGKKLTRDEVAAFVRANQIEVIDIAKGAGTDDPRMAAIERLTAAGYSITNDYIAELNDGDTGRLIDLMTLTPELAADWELVRYNLPEANDAGEPVSTQFHQYQLPGGENYREILLALPAPTEQQMGEFNTRMIQKYGESYDSTMLTPAERAEERRMAGEGKFTQGHWDEPNVLAHVRFNDRTDADGKRVLFIEEIQSDWHQKGRKSGYLPREGIGEIDQIKSVDEFPEGWTYQIEPDGNVALRDESGAVKAKRTPGAFMWGTPQAEIDAAVKARAVDLYNSLLMSESRQSVAGLMPDAPFKTTWPELAMKRMIRFAAENGYDRVAWTPGQVQADRYSLAQALDSIEWSVFAPGGNNADGSKNVVYQIKGDTGASRLVVSSEGIVEAGSGDANAFMGKRLDDVFGKDVAEKIMDDAYGSLDGDGLRIGGEGMVGFYDKILRDTAAKLIKKFGGKVGTTKIDTGNKPARSRTESTELRADVRRAVKSFMQGDLTNDEFREEMPYPDLMTDDQLEEIAFLPQTPDGVTAGVMAVMDHIYARDGIGKRSAHAFDMTPQLREAAMQGMPLFRDQQGPAKGASATQVYRWLKDQPLYGYVRVVKDVETLRKLLGDPSIEPDTNGVYTLGDDKAYLVASRIPSLEMAEAVYRHEVEGHLAVEIFGDVQQAVGDILAAKDSAAIAPLWAEVAKAQPNLSPKLHAREVIALVAERGIAFPAVARLIGRVRALLRKLGITLDFTEADIRAIIANAARAASKDLARKRGAVERRARVLNEMAAARSADRVASRGGRPELDHTGLIDASFKHLGGKQLAKMLTSPLYDRLIRAGGRLVPEKVKQGFISDYGLPEPYLDAKIDKQASVNRVLRKTRNLVEMLSGLDREQSRVAYLWMTTDPEKEGDDGFLAADRLLEQLPEDSRAVLQRMKELVDELGREAVEVGLLTEDSYARNKMAYLHRTYQTHMATAGESVQARHKKNASVRAGNFKGRGLRDDVAPDSLGEYELGETRLRIELRGPRGGLQEVKYIRPDDAVPDGWTIDGEWEVRWLEQRPGQGEMIGMWRDLTAEERQRLGEIEEVRFAFAKTMLNAIHDIENQKFLGWVGETYAVEPSDDLDMVEASDGFLSLKTYRPDQYVKVPNVGIPKTPGLKKYGALSGKVIPAVMWNDIRNAMALPDSEVGRFYDKIMRAWKISKTALSPTVHTNNILSNFILADIAEVRGRDVARALKTIIAARSGDEAAKELIARYEDSGAESGSFHAMELQQDIIRPLLLELQNVEDESLLGQLSVANIVALLKAGDIKNAAKAVGQKGGIRQTLSAGRRMIDVYRNEDSVFRLAKFMRELDAGRGDRDAGKAARDAFLNYEINAPAIQAARRTVLPFVAFSYRAIPKMLETAAHKPWKLGKYFMAGYVLNALAYAMLGKGGDDEDEERALLPEELQGRVLGVFPRLVRLPWNDKNNAPTFLDVRRWVPAGDMMDTMGSHGVVPLPNWLSVGGPIAFLLEAYANKSTFTGEPIVKDSDTASQKAAKFADYAFKWAAPNLPLPNPLNFVVPAGREGDEPQFIDLGLLPGVDRDQLQTYAWTGVMRAGTGREDAFGRESGSVRQALASSIGIKARSYPIDVAKKRVIGDVNATTREIDQNIRQLAKERARGGLTEAEYRQRIEYEVNKKRSLYAEAAAKLGAGVESR